MVITKTYFGCFRNKQSSRIADSMGQVCKKASLLLTMDAVIPVRAVKRFSLSVVKLLIWRR